LGEQFIEERKAPEKTVPWEVGGTHIQLRCLFVTNWFWLADQLCMSLHQLSTPWVISGCKMNVKLQDSTLKMEAIVFLQNSTYI